MAKKAERGVLEAAEKTLKFQNCVVAFCAPRTRTLWEKARININFSAYTTEVLLRTIISKELSIDHANTTNPSCICTH
jgi:hypothetical protein